MRRIGNGCFKMRDPPISMDFIYHKRFWTTERATTRPTLLIETHVHPLNYEVNSHQTLVYQEYSRSRVHQRGQGLYVVCLCRMFERSVSIVGRSHRSTCFKSTYCIEIIQVIGRTASTTGCEDGNHNHNPSNDHDVRWVLVFV